ncbi:MAG: type II toxin-antitoxin system VapC family toxin [Gemmataceae bacterium]|nr:type II toxin-antitoxin system VapC family toxin [Gemmataceae bacterium]
MSQTLLLDTHTFIWFDVQSTRLSASAKQLIADTKNRKLLSAASIWEMSIKVGNGRLQLIGDLSTVVRDQVSRNGIEILPVTADHALTVQSLPPIHRDPFDRMLVAQAILESSVLISCDPNIAKYPVTVIW